MLPGDFPPLSTVQGYFYAWRNTGLLQAMNHILVMATHELKGKEASPTAGVIDSQSAKTTESGGLSGFDAGKKVKGRKALAGKGDWKRDTSSSTAWAIIASIRLMTRRLAPYCYVT
jgi:hypothetical protein